MAGEEPGLNASSPGSSSTNYFFLAAVFALAGAVGAAAAAAFFAGAAAFAFVPVDFAAGAASLFAAAAAGFLAIAVVPLLLRDFSFTESAEPSRSSVKRHLWTSSLSAGAVARDTRLDLRGDHTLRHASSRSTLERS